jgi:hypothetical protein
MVSKSTSTASSSGIGITGALGLLFIGLKLGDVIDWSWIWVLAPFWIPFAALFAALLILLIIYAVNASSK